MLACFAVEGLDWGSRVSPRFHQTGIGRAACPISVGSVSGASYYFESLNFGMNLLNQQRRTDQDRIAMIFFRAAPP